MLSRGKSLAAMAAVTAALAAAAPAASASATTATATPTAAIGPAIGAPPYLFCAELVREVQVSLATGNLAGANFLARVFQYSGCGGAAI
jgi:hypothetical protein